MIMGTLSSSNKLWQLPDYTLNELYPKQCKYCVCVFVINEGQKVRIQLEAMKKVSSIVDIIIADGGSTDGSLELGFLRQQNVRTLLTKHGTGKLGAQMRMAFSYAISHGYEGIVVMDGNNKDDPKSIPLFLQALDDGYDHIQGSRFVPGGQAINTPLSRLLGVHFIHAPLISLAAGFRYTDTTNGFRAYSRRLLLDERVAPFRDIFSGYELHYYLAIRSSRLGFKVKEIPVTRAYPGKGPTPTKISPLKGNIKILGTLIYTCLGMCDP